MSHVLSLSFGRLTCMAISIGLEGEGRSCDTIMCSGRELLGTSFLKSMTYRWGAMSTKMVVSWSPLGFWTVGYLFMHRFIFAVWSVDSFFFATRLRIFL